MDVAQAAGLTSTIIYGEPDSFTYIIESMATGCAFFDYDNDGWMDIFILGGRTLVGTPPGSGNRLYHNNRDGTFTDVTAKSGLADRDGTGLGAGRLRRATTTTTAVRISFSPTTARIASTATTATAPLPM